ncbi:hypothetical protein [Bradyrhizobium sp. LeoA1S1]
MTAAVEALRAEGPVTLLLGDRALRGRALELAGRIAAKTGCRLMSEANNARMETGAGRADAPRFSPNVDAALAAFQDVKCGSTRLLTANRHPILTPPDVQ